MNISATLDRVLTRYQDLGRALAEGPGRDARQFGQLSKEYSDMGPVVQAIEALKRAQKELEDLEAISADKSSDKEMREMADAELRELRAKMPALERQVQVMLLPKDEADAKNAILEVRAGTGGDEAALFAADLFRMYTRYADLKGWKVDVISMSENDLGGYKEVVASISGAGVFARMKFESGVHRVQRIPATESSGRIHTSAATVAVLPEAEEVDIDIRPEDIRIDTMRASGAGGQHVNKTDSAVRITHIPTGIIVVSAEKSQHQNRRLAMQVLRSRLYEEERERNESARSEARKSQVGSGDRSQRIRTYNFPQGRVTDHRINVTLHNIERVMDGTGLDEIIDQLITDHQASLLAEMEGNAA